MAEYLSRPRIEGPIWLESSDISFLQTQLSETETHIEDLEKQISELMRQKDAKVLERDSIQNILSPIRRAPVEILSEILELSCLPEDGIFSADYDLFRHASAVSRVCVAWRKAAHSTPRIWSKICLSVRKHEMVLLKLGLFMAGITEWIVRSQGLPLDVYLRITLISAEVMHFKLHVGIRDLEQHSLPLFRLPCSSLPSFGEVEQLTSLVINSRHWNTGFDLAQAKNLVSLTLDSPEFGVVGVSLTLPALRILDVSIRDIPNNPLQALTTPLLEDLTLRWLTQDIHDAC
ncbi:hypothetical protein BT96DRAFT_1010350 [Gymnopus androsaceus JB14]|uniref:Uncharacterized protein n=1 Tax=Gymnopus androsaceus JB14 TaxID=1447944 RepID=A0A6A4GAV0_9AGAR|nr:hypothetical protein BT96DRAFT_1010350 [Gymnopus androsaceus JB14]